MWPGYHFPKCIIKASVGARIFVWEGLGGRGLTILVPKFEERISKFVGNRQTLGGGVSNVVYIYSLIIIAFQL